MREIFRFKSLLTRPQKRFECIALNHKNYLEDDLIKALSLSGTFFAFDKEFQELYPIFSGMLVPHQTVNDTRYLIHSCLHGTLGEKNDLFFVPYGLAYTDGIEPLFDYAFQVQSIYSSLKMDKIFSNDHIKNPSLDYEYSHPDYAMITIMAQSSTNAKNLKTILNERQSFNIFDQKELFTGFTIEESLPNFTGNHVSFSDSFDKFHLTNHHMKYFMIGRPSDRRLSFDESGFAIVSNIQNSQINNFKKSEHNDPQLFVPESLKECQNQVALDIPSAQGMSGGIVLQSIFINQEEKLQRVCRPFGTLWGSERIYVDNKMIGLYSIINKIID